MKPNIFFLLIDSFRADKCFGENKTAKTPNIDSIIKSGACFQQTISAADATPLSIGSIFTGLYPFKTGIGLDGHNFSTLHSKAISYIPILKNYGYSAYGTVPNIESLKSIYNDFENPDKFFPVKPTFMRLAEGLGNRIIKQLRSKMKEPWIYYSHILDLHAPLSIPKEINESEFGDSYYERMISSIDEWVGKIISEIDLKKTIFIITADHGCFVPTIMYKNSKVSSEENNLETDKEEKKKKKNKIPSFLNPIKDKAYFNLQNLKKRRFLKKIKKMNISEYEKRNLSAPFMRNDRYRILYDDYVKVPLILNGSKIPSMGAISKLARTIDIFPTLTDLIGMPNRDESIDGKSLKAYFSNNEKKKRTAYIQSFFPIEKSTNCIIGLRTEEYKFMKFQNKSKKSKFLFDLNKDPFEEINIAKENIEKIEELEKELEEILKDKLRDNEKNFTSDEETARVKKQLRELGYLK